MSRNLKTHCENCIENQVAGWLPENSTVPLDSLGLNNPGLKRALEDAKKFGLTAVVV